MQPSRLDKASQTPPRMIRRTAWLVAAVMSLTLTSCADLWPSEGGKAELEKFASATAFRRYLADQVEAERSRYWWNLDYIALGADGPAPQGDPEIPDTADQRPSPLPGMAPADSAGIGSDGFSTTNIQEVGVDESDQVKTDGTYLYILDGDQVQIVRAVPADDMEVMSVIDLPHRTAELYLKGSQLVALGSGYDRESDTTLTIVTIVDVKDRSSPWVAATVEAQGSLISSRLIGPKLHLVMSLTLTFPLGDQPFPIMLTRVDAMIPDLSVTLADGTRKTRNLVDWDDLYHPVEPDGHHVTAVVTLDIDVPDEPRHSVGVVANAGTVYASTEALYLTDTDYDAGGLIRESTDIYKFDLKDDGARASAAGSVPGRILNRFSLGEHDGHLRVATTIGHVARSGDGDATNNVYVLAPSGNRLAIVGKIEGIAPTERIYAARFLGKRGFLVTFKKVDPLFTLDLSDPTSPRVVGELKVPGYSDYIHPLGENHLLTIGKDAVDAGGFAWYQGVQLSVFDVTDFADPRLVDAVVIGDRGTESQALHNPHAFTFFPPADTLAVPMTIVGGAGWEPSSSGSTVFEGLCLFHVTKDDGIELLRGIETKLHEEYLPEAYRRRPRWTRGLFIGEHVYSVTPVSVQALPLAALDSDPMLLLLE